MYRMFLEREVAAKPFEEFPQAAKDEVHLVSYNPDKPPTVVGSFAYRIQKYPADIDIIESVDSYKVHGVWTPATNPSEIIAGFSKRIKKIVKNIEATPSHFILDFKAGADDRYYFKLGHMQNGYLQLDQNFMAEVIKRYEYGLYSEDEYEAITSLAQKPSLDQHVYDALTKIMRSRYILRWTAADITRGTIKLPLGEQMTLEHALSQHQLVKMDVAGLVNGRFMEVSNIWTLFYMSSVTNTYSYMTPPPKLEYVPYDIEKLYWSDMYFSPFKVVKRIFSYSRLQYLRGHAEYEQYIRKIASFITGDTSSLYQIRSELETILTLYDMKKIHGSAHVNRQVDGMKNRIAVNLAVSNQQMTEFGRMIDSYLQGHNVGMLGELAKALKKIISINSISFLNNTSMSPPPLIVLPTVETAEELTRAGTPINPFLTMQMQKTYDWTVRRTLDVSVGGMLGRTQEMHSMQYDPEARAQRIRVAMISKAGCETCGGGDEECPCCGGSEVCTEMCKVACKPVCQVAFGKGEDCYY